MDTLNKVQANVGALDDMGKRFSSAWNRATAGEQVNETNVTFLDVQTMRGWVSKAPMTLARLPSG